MFPGVIRPPTHAGPPGRKRASQHLTHLSKRHRCQMNSGCLQKRTLTRRLSHRSLPMLGSYPLPAVVSRLHFQNAKRRKSSTGTPSSPPLPRINLDPLVLETMRRPGCRAPKKSLRHCTVTQTTQRLPPATRGPLSKPPHSSTSRHHVTLMPLVSPLCPRPSTLAASSCWPQCLLSVFVLTPGACFRVLTVSPHVLIVCSSGLSGPRCFPLQLSGSLPRPTSGRNVTSGRRPTLLAARLALHTTLVKQPLASPSWSIVPVARACAHQDSCT